MAEIWSVRGKRRLSVLAWALALVGLGAGVFLLDRFLLWSEERGWIYYRRKKASPGTLGSAFLEIQGMLQADARHTAEAIRIEAPEVEEHGDPPSDTERP
ncbi:MAG: hypothetical protein ABR961_11600 [Thermoanaerobaculaceae bacterium]|jgi:hypothetical protein